jgi:hypothetical protein
MSRIPTTTRKLTLAISISFVASLSSNAVVAVLPPTGPGSGIYGVTESSQLPPNFDASQSAVMASQALRPSAATNLMVPHRLPNQFDTSSGRSTFSWTDTSVAMPGLQKLPLKDRGPKSAEFFAKRVAGVDANSPGNEAVLANIQKLPKGPTIAKYRQKYRGVEVFNREVNVLLDDRHQLVASSGYFAQVDRLNGKLPSTAFMSDYDAVSLAVEDLLGRGATFGLQKASTAGDFERYNGSSSAQLRFNSPIMVKPVYFELRSELIASKLVVLSVTDLVTGLELNYSVVVDSAGKTLFRNNHLQHATEKTYRTYADTEDMSPLQGPHGDVIPKVGDGPDKTDIDAASTVSVDFHPSISTGDPWIPVPAEGEFLTTTLDGNNATAYGDIDGLDGLTEGDILVPATSEDTYDYVLDRNAASSYEGWQAAIVNLFYVINYLHDWWYDYGFDEASGNGQADNYGRGGIGGDPIRAEGQDASGFNNANMATGPDGGFARMQQYLFFDGVFGNEKVTNGVDYGLEITQPDLGLVDQAYGVIMQPLGPLQFDTVSAEVTLVTDSLGNLDGCAEITDTEQVAGKIGLALPGGCPTSVVAKNFQDAGAAAALVYYGGNALANIAPGIEIPVGILVGSDADMVANPLLGGEVVAADFYSNVTPITDSTFDNGIVAHEWGHFIQNRLVGNANGLINFQGRAMGEGWSDFHALMLFAEEYHKDIEGNAEFQAAYPISSHSMNFFNGIRRAPYTPDMNINPLTFLHIVDGEQPPGLPATSNGSPHAAGEVWASMLWDVYVGLLNTYDFEEAQSRMATYLVGGYKMTPIAPTYTEARDALLSVMYASEPDDFTMALAAFARRGMGAGAIPPGRFDSPLTSVTESYETILSTYAPAGLNLNADYDGVDEGFCTLDGIWDAGETVSMSVDITNRGTTVIDEARARLTVTSDHDVTIASDGLITATDIDLFETKASSEITMTLNSAAVADTLSFQLEFEEVVDEDDTLEPVPLDFTIGPVNYTIQPKPLVEGATIEDMETSVALVNLEQTVLSSVDVNAASLTQSFDSANMPFFQSLTGDNLGLQGMRLADNGFAADVAVQTQPFTVSAAGDFSVSFFHFYQIESGWDGGVVEVSVDGSDWTDVEAAGGTFAVGYPSGFNAAGGRFGFTGQGWGAEQINFGEQLAGSSVQLRFRIISDEIVGDYGWMIDNVVLSNIAEPVFFELASGAGLACDNTVPRVTIVDPEASIDEGDTGLFTASVTDRNGPDSHTYAWQQMAGPAVAMSGVDSSDMEFSTPLTRGDASVEFMVTVTDESLATASATHAMTINNVPPALDVTESLTGDNAVAEGTQTEISVAVTNSTDDDEYTYEWTQVSGTTASIGSSADAITAVGLPRIRTATETLVFSVAVDDGFDRNEETVSITVENVPPVISASLSEPEVRETGTVTASVSVINSGPGESYTYSWTQLSGSTATLTGANSSSVTIETNGVSADEEQTFQVSVDDGVVATTDTVTLMVKNKKSSWLSSDWMLGAVIAALLLLYRRRLLGPVMH